LAGRQERDGAGGRSAGAGILPCGAAAFGPRAARRAPAAGTVGPLAARRRAVGRRAAGARKRTWQPLAAPGAFPHARYRNAPQCGIPRAGARRRRAHQRGCGACRCRHANGRDRAGAGRAVRPLAAAGPPSYGPGGGIGPARGSRAGRGVHGHAARSAQRPPRCRAGPSPKRETRRRDLRSG